MSGLPDLDAHPVCTLTPNPNAGMNTPVLPPMERGARMGGHTSVDMQLSLLHKNSDTRAAQTSLQPNRGDLTTWQGTHVRCISSL